MLTNPMLISSVCPGRYMALSAVWISVASLIAAFDITKAVDEKGEVIEPSYEYCTEMIWYVCAYYLCNNLLNKTRLARLFHSSVP
jgi:hypothetical protein